MLFQNYDQNSKGRDFVCGDIYGCFSDLEDSIMRIRFDFGKDRMILCRGFNRPGA